MTENTDNNLFFAPGLLNTLILDAHSTFSHIKIHKFALEKKQRFDQSMQQLTTRSLKQKEHLEKVKDKKRKFG